MINKKDSTSEKIIRECRTCFRCGWRWFPRKEETVCCPNCKSPYWDKPKTSHEKS